MGLLEELNYVRFVFFNIFFYEKCRDSTWYLPWKCMEERHGKVRISWFGLTN